VLPAVAPVPDVEEPVLPDPLPAFAIVPVTSTFWPTYCWRFWLSPPVRRYVDEDPRDALVLPAPAAPVVPVAVAPPARSPPAVELLAVEPLPLDEALVSMNAPLAWLLAPAVAPPAAAPPVVELAAPPLADCRQPVTVIVWLVWLARSPDWAPVGDWDPAPEAGGCCAATPTASAALSMVPNIN
jgi:hypothetical protein